MFTKLDCDWYNRTETILSDHIYVEYLLKRNLPEIDDFIENNFKFFFKQPILLPKFCKRFFDYSESPQENFRQDQYDRILIKLEQATQDLYMN